MRALPPRARAYFLAVVCGAVGALGWALVAHPRSSRAVTDLLVFVVLFAAVSAYGTSKTSTRHSFSFTVSFIVGLGAVSVVGVSGACLVGAAGFVGGSRGVRVPLVKRTFNGAQFTIAGLCSAAVYAAAGGPVGDALRPSAFPEVLVPTALAALVYLLVNNTLVAGIVALTSGQSVRRFWLASLSPTVVTYFGYGLLGLLLATLYLEVGAVAAVLLLAPLLVARAAFANYVELREAYDSTVRALVQAVETKDYYTRGHSERVSRVTEMIAREWGMREDRVQVIRIAGMLHDVGKLGVPTKVLQKQGKLSEKEFEAIKLHPLRGYEMLCEIDFLGEALSGVYHHHERMDGRGYPMGLSDAEIPEFARIIMVADAFDSMTSTRSYRLAKPVDEAIAELRRWQGAQFDPTVVDCLVRAVEKHGWEPHPEAFFGEKVTRDGRPIESDVPVVTTRAGLTPVVVDSEQDGRVAGG